MLALVPEEERVFYSAMTGQSLFYMGEEDLKHKVLAIVEEEGAERASYALKLLQSEGELQPQAVLPLVRGTGDRPAGGGDAAGPGALPAVALPLPPGRRRALSWASQCHKLVAVKMYQRWLARSKVGAGERDG